MKKPNLIILITLVILASGCFKEEKMAGDKLALHGAAAASEPAATEKVGRGAPEILPDVEVSDYKGEKLSSSGDFRENSIKGPRKVDIETYRLTVDGLVEKPLEMKFDEVVSGFDRYRKVIKLHCVEGWTVNILWEGALVGDLVAAAGVKPEAKVVIFHSADGYSTSISLEYLIDRKIILADMMNGVPLKPERGFPLQLAAEGKWGYKWAKWVTRLELSDDTDYRGYWERRGYSNDGGLDGRIFE